MVGSGELRIALLLPKDQFQLPSCNGPKCLCSIELPDLWLKGFIICAELSNSNWSIWLSAKCKVSGMGSPTDSLNASNDFFSAFFAKEILFETSRNFEVIKDSGK